MGGACSPFIHCLVQPFIPCMLLEGRGRRTKFLDFDFSFTFLPVIDIQKWTTAKTLDWHYFFAIWRVSARSGCIGVVEAPRPIYKLFVYIAMHCAIHIVVFLFFYVWCLSKCTTCNRCIVRGEGGGVWAFIQVVEPSVMSWVSRPLPVVRLTGWFSDLLVFFLLDS